MQRSADSSLVRRASTGQDGSFHAGGQSTTNGGANTTRHLFETPPELVCPITQELLFDPVLTTSGQVYERTAIETHLMRAASASMPMTDPLTNTPLASDQLLPVFPMRSRAAEYREGSVRACVSLAVSEPRRSEAIRYLRRAAELVLPPAQLQRCSSSSTDNGAARMAKRSGSRRSGQRAAGSAEDGEEGQLMVQAPGLSAELAQFVVSHRGEAYSAVALKWFGNELMRGGFPDQAADVFYGLLLEECDRQQQADYLALCLECWGHKAAGGTRKDPCSEPTHAAGSAVGTDSAIISKLADFVERQQCLSAGDVIDMLQSPTGLGRAGALRLCDALLARAAAAGGGGGSGLGGSGRRGSGCGGPSQGVGSGQGGQSELARAVELLVRYVRLSAAEAADGARAALLQHQRETQLAAAAAAAQAWSGSSSEAASEPGGYAEGQQRRGGSGVREAARRARAVMGKGPVRAAASCVLAVASLAGGSGLAIRAARLLPLLVLLHGAGGKDEK